MTLEQTKLFLALTEQMQAALKQKNYKVVREIITQLKTDSLLKEIQNLTLPIKKLAMEDKGYHQFLIEGILKDCKRALCAKNVLEIEKNLLKIAGLVPSDVLSKLQDRIKYFKISLLREEHQFNAIASLAQKGVVDAIFYLAKHFSQPLGLLIKKPHTRKAEGFYLALLVVLQDPKVVASLSDADHADMVYTMRAYIFRSGELNNYRREVLAIYDVISKDAQAQKLEAANPFVVVLNYFKKHNLTQSLYYEEQVGKIINFDTLQKEYKSRQDQKFEWPSELNLLPITTSVPSSASHSINTASSPFSP